MARPIALTSRPHDPREETKQQLQEAPVKHADAVLAAYETLQTLHDSGILDILRGMAGASDHLVGEITEQLNTPHSVRGLRNLLTLSKLLGNIDPDWLETIASSAQNAMEGSKNRTGEPPSTWEILKKSRSEDSRRALSAAVSVLEAVGKALGSDKKSHSSGRS